MPAAIAMAAAKLSPMLPAISKPVSSFSSSSSLNQSTTSVSTISIPVSAFHDPASNVITITPYIFVKTATVAEQMQALRQDKKIGKPPEQPAGALRVKRRTDLSKLGLPDAKPASVSRRNARERNRVKQVNLGFETLREHVPNGKKNKKMSKVQTLRSAAQYIKDLYMILHGELPALGSPNVIDELEPNSPIDNSMSSISDTDDMSVASPQPKFHHLQGQQTQQHEQSVAMESDAIPESPISSVFSPNIMHSPPHHQQQQLQHSQPQEQKQQPLILKKEHVSVLQQQLSRGQLSQIESITNQMKYQHLQQNHQKPLHEQQHQQIKQQHVQSQLQEQAQPHQQLQNVNPSALRLDPLTCTTVLGLSNANSVLQTWNTALTLTELSPVELADEQCDNYMVVSPKQDVAHLHTDPNFVNSKNNNKDESVNMDLPSPPMFQPFLSDLNMNVISSRQSDSDALQNYYKSVHNEHFKNVESSFLFDLDQKSNNNNNNNNRNNNSFLVGQSSNVVHSPAPSLSSTTSTGSSEADTCTGAQFDYDNLDREALLDISDWISEICSQGLQLNDTSIPQQLASMAYSH